MKFYLHILAIFFVLFQVTSCTSTKQLMADAAKYEQNGLDKEAFELYKQVHITRPNQVDAHIAAKNLGNKLLTGLLSQMQVANTLGNFERSMEIFVETEAFLHNNQFLGLEMSEAFRKTYQAARSGKVEQLYQEAEQSVMEGNYSKAQDLLNAIYRYDRNFEKAAYLEDLSELYPAYEKGVKAKDLGLFKEAYYYFEQVTSVDIEFKDAWNLQEECREAASFSLAYIPLHSGGVEKEVEAAVGTAINQNILALADPFVTLLDRQNIDALIQEQLASMSVHFDQDKALEAGKLEGAEYVLTGEVIAYSNTLGRKTHEAKKGYLGRTVVSPKVHYEEFEQSRTIATSFRFQLLNTETGQIFMAETVPFLYSDTANYIVYNGDVSKLYPGEWMFGIIGSRQDVVYNSKEAKAELDAKGASAREPISKIELDQKFIEFLGRYLAEKITKFEPTR